MDDSVGTGYIRLDDFGSVYRGILTVKFVIQLLAKSTERCHIGNPKTPSVSGGFSVCKDLFGDVMLDYIFETLIVFGKE